MPVCGVRCASRTPESRGRWWAGVVLDPFLGFLCPGGHFPVLPCSKPGREVLPWARLGAACQQYWLAALHLSADKP